MIYVKYIAKPDTFFKEGTECILENDEKWMMGDSWFGIFRGKFELEDIPYHKLWINEGYKVGDLVEKGEHCCLDEFDIIDE